MTVGWLPHTCIRILRKSLIPGHITCWQILTTKSKERKTTGALVLITNCDDHSGTEVNNLLKRMSFNRGRNFAEHCTYFHSDTAAATHRFKAVSVRYEPAKLNNRKVMNLTWTPISTSVKFHLVHPILNISQNYTGPPFNIVNTLTVPKLKNITNNFLYLSKFKGS